MIHDTIKILLVEDNQDDVQFLKGCLQTSEHQQFSLVQTERLGKIKNLIYSNDFDAVLLDLSLPDSDGIETVRRAVEATPNLPIIALTDIGDNGLSIQALQAGAQDYLIKSKTNSDILIRSINHAIERKHINKALRESEDRYRSLFDGILDGVYRSTQKGKFIEINQAMVEMFGYTDKEDMMKIDIPKELYFCEKDRQNLFLDSGQKNVRTFRMRKKDGSEIWVEDHGHYIHDKKGNVIFHEGILRDVTERKRSEHLQAAVYSIAKAAINASTLDELFKMVHDIISEVMYSSNFYIALFDDEKNLISFPYFVDEFDKAPQPRKPLKGLTEYVLMTGESLLCDETLFEKLVAADKVEPIGAPSPIWLGVPLIMNNKTIGVMAVQHYTNVKAFGEYEKYILEFVSSEVARVISHKSAEQQLVLLVTALESAANTIVMTNPLGQIIWTNPAFTRMTGFQKEEVIGQNLNILKSGKHDKKFYQNLWETINAGKVWHGEITNKKKDGSLYTEEMTITPVKNPNGEIVNFTAVKQDISEKKIIESQLLRAQRMESMGVLAGGIAHDLNNVFSPIMMALELLSHNIDSEKREKMLEILKSNTMRGSNIVKQVLTFSRGAEGERIPLQPKHLLREIENFAKQTFPKDIDIHMNVPTDLWIIIGDATQIHQILLNLCVNARDAMPHGGKLTISAENFIIDANYSKMNPTVQPGPYILFRVADGGTGIPKSILDRIFDPFFTTKEIGKGTGLGLSTVMGIVKSHKGIINVYSEVGKGTEFKVYLPAAETNNFREVIHSKDILPHGNGECILVVDDEASIRDITKTTLESFGYSVITANDGVEAIAAFVQNKAKVKLIITDMAMPVLDGIQSVLTIKKLDPNIKIIATSGLLSQKNEIELLSPTLKGFLQKPFSADKLIRMVHSVLNKS